MNDLRRVHLTIRGRVQGVFYRQSALDEGTRLGLTGWVRNRRSGEVEAMVEGPKDRVEEFIAWCWEGPTHAQVSAIDVEEAAAGDRFEAFRVEPTA